MDTDKNEYEEVPPKIPYEGGVTQTMLDNMNIEQQRKENRESLTNLGGVEFFMHKLGVSIETGVRKDQLHTLRERFGDNTFPESPMDTYLALLLGALADVTLLILMAAAFVSLIIGFVEDPVAGWIEGAAILIAVALVANITAFNDYSKQLQFRALESTSQEDERCSVFRDGVIERINPREICVGDIMVLQAGDQIPADCILLSHGVEIKANESSLTGEPDDVKKSYEKDCFLLSSCLITEGEEVRAAAIGIGTHSQWSKIKMNLVAESANTPLQDKLQEMTTKIGYLGMFIAAASFIVLVVSIWTRHNGEDILDHIVHAFILAVTIVVVAIPEGLPLAVTISLAYSTKKMYQDQCFIRVLAACETMGNATNICSDKTGTLTENRMTVVEGWFADEIYNQDQFEPSAIRDLCKRVLVEQISVNRSAYLVTHDQEGKELQTPIIIGNKTEGALIMMIRSWGFDYEEVRKSVYNEEKDKVYSFNSDKKRSTAILHRTDGSVRVYVKGASEWILRDCTMFLDQSGGVMRMSDQKRDMLENHIESMAHMALRTLCLAHKDFANASEMPENWHECPPDDSELCLDCIVGIIDPLRGDVIEAVKMAQRAGVTVRMVTGDNVATAAAIARQCGILTANGIAVEGPKFRKMSPKEVDAILPRIQVMARSSPDDKYLMVTRLNGHGIPNGQAEWETKMSNRGAVTWENDRDKFLPGYRAEWEAVRPEGGRVVGVTGDGTNDAPALKAADVGLAMGITGTKVAQGAADIVILDDKFSSIVRAILWGRAVYDNIRKFLQFQLTVNCVALTVVFIAACAGFEEPLNPVQLLWVNLVMDTLGALALGTEPPYDSVLQRAPYKRSASLISRPMARNLLCEFAFQVTLLFVLLFAGPGLFNIHEGITCARYSSTYRDTMWNAITGLQTTDPTEGTVDCDSWINTCGGKGIDCYEEVRTFTAWNGQQVDRSFESFDDYEGRCLECTKFDYTHGSIMFNSFIFCQFWNEYTSRNLFDELNPFYGIWRNPIFLFVSVATIGFQIFMIEVGGDFVKTTPLSPIVWLICVALGAIGVPVGVLMRFIPVKEDPNAFFDNEKDLKSELVTKA